MRGNMPFWSRTASIIEAHIKIEIGRKGQPKQVRNKKSERPPTISPSQAYKADHRSQQQDNHSQPRPRHTPEEEAHAPQKIEHTLYAPKYKQTPSARPHSVGARMPHRPESKTNEHIQQRPRYRKDISRRSKRRLLQIRIPRFQCFLLKPRGQCPQCQAKHHRPCIRHYPTNDSCFHSIFLYATRQNTYKDKKLAYLCKKIKRK